MSMTARGARERALALLCLIALAACGEAESSAAAAAQAGAGARRHPDIFLFVVDTLRADRLACYGYRRPTSPSIDALAARGVLFEDATAQCSWTKPSVVSLMSGRYVTTYRDLYEPEAPVLPEILREAGYRTLAVIGNVLLSERSGFDRGFEHFDARRRSDADEGKGPPGRTADQLAEDLWTPLQRALEPLPGGGRPPLFVWIHVMDPHRPYYHHPKLDRELPWRKAPALHARQVERFAAGGAPAPEEDPEWRRIWRRMHHDRNRYDQEVRFSDEQIGAILEGLEGLGLLEHAVVALAGDHGELLWDQPTLATPEKLAALPPDQFLHGEHGVLQYQPLIATPLLFQGAGVPQGRRVAEPVENVDLVPTLLELAGVAAPPTLHGESLVGLMHGRAGGWSKDVFSFVMQHVSVREADTHLKLIVPTEAGSEAGGTPKLFDLRADPAELVDLHDERPGDVARLAAKIEAWRERHPTVSSIGRALDADEIEDLRALGYLGDDGEPDPDVPDGHGGHGGGPR